QHDEQQATITALYKDGQPVDSLQAGDEGLVILDKTAFYAESGGQVGDTGVLKNDSANFTVTDTQKYGQAIGHVGKVESGSLVVNHRIAAIVNSERRNAIRLNHSAAHLLHAALRQVLGEHVSQKGSLVNDKYLRFDFSHFEAMTQQQLRQVEDIVNAQIRQNSEIETELMDLEGAKAKGAMALFGEKYEE
ncbi:alanine--tRNA ligase-related protein, partial [Providencia rettgeri]|uniref:alanine--tRNA ligase-related protein n=1 Tax=Providencia rettgeri TaxID=587 RepID=UPI0032DB2813